MKKIVKKDSKAAPPPLAGGAAIPPVIAVSPTTAGPASAPVTASSSLLTEASITTANRFSVDLNADIGEGGSSDEALLALVSSANIACGWHAGGAVFMQRTVAWAISYGVAIGAHPSFPDAANFGRREMHLSAEEIYSGLLYQIGALAAIAKVQGAHLSHVKPHGALYNQAARDPKLADVIVAAVRDFDSSLALFGLANSALIDAASRVGLRAVEEVFADRGYNADGSLVKRGTPGDMIEDEEQALAQTMQMLREGKVHAIDGSWVPLTAHTICLHGDGAHPLAFAQRIRTRLAQEGIVVAAPEDSQAAGGAGVAESSEATGPRATQSAVMPDQFSVFPLLK